MAKPIAPTPTLSGEESQRFMARLQDQIKNLVKATPTPKANKTIQTIMADAASRQK